MAYSLWTLSYFFCAYSWHWSDLGEIQLLAWCYCFRLSADVASQLESNCSISLMWYTPLIASLPPWWRLLQCLRRYRDSSELVHLANALKYTSSIVATIIGAVRKSHCKYFDPQHCRTIYSCIFDITLLANTAITTLWILASFINSCYTSVWDIKMDWGLLHPSSQNFLLRDDLVFHKAVSISYEMYHHGCFLTRRCRQ